MTHKTVQLPYETAQHIKQYLASLPNSSGTFAIYQTMAQAIEQTNEQPVQQEIALASILKPQPVLMPEPAVPLPEDEEKKKTHDEYMKDLEQRLRKAKNDHERQVIIDHEWHRQTNVMRPSAKRLIDEFIANCPEAQKPQVVEYLVRSGFKPKYASTKVWDAFKQREKAKAKGWKK